jgi:hypothetical protein
MIDIVERLRAFAGEAPGWAHSIFGEAAAEIERLHNDYSILKEDYDVQHTATMTLSDLINHHLCDLTRLELTILREVIDELISRDEWKQWLRDDEFRKERKAAIQTILAGGEKT